MKAAKKKIEKVGIEYENIKVPKKVVDKLRRYKSQTGVSIMSFTVQAIQDRLKLTSDPKYTINL